jgi:hypothetical protein
MAKLSKNQMIILGVLLLFIIITSAVSCGVVPYVKAPNYSSFEPFETANVKSSLIPETQNGQAILTPQLTRNKSVESVSEKDEVKGKEGFTSYAPFNLNDAPQTIDIFSKLPTNSKCSDSGYTKNGGFVCLDENVKKMIMQRGVNY